MRTFQTILANQMATQAAREGQKDTNALATAFAPSPARDRNAAHLVELTTREKEILQLIAEGKANKEAASELCISTKTIEKHRENLMDKLGIRGTARLTHYAIAVGIIQCNPWLGANKV